MALDVMSNSPFVSQANTRQVVNQTSLRAFFHALLQLFGIHVCIV